MISTLSNRKQYILLIFGLFMLSMAYTQEVRVIDNKGTINSIRNNQVTTSATAPLLPLEGDVWIDTSGNANISKIYDTATTSWLVIDLDNVSVNTTQPSPRNIGDIWFDNTTPTNITTQIWDGTTWIQINTNDADFDITNEINTAFSAVDTNADGNIDSLRITDSSGNLDVPLSDLEHTGTTGSVFFAGADGRPTENNGQLFWNNMTNQLFVGSSSLTGGNKFNVSGTTRTSGLNNSNGTAGQPSYRFSSDADTGMFLQSENNLAFTTDDTEALRIDANQQVNIFNNLSVVGNYQDSSGDSGTNGQILSSTATGTNWVDASTLSPVKAMGKVNANGTVARPPLNASVTRLGTGQYQITLTPALPNANYIIQLTIRDSAGAGNDDYDLSYSNQTTTGFIVQVGDNDNGGGNRANRDFEFMFTVLDY